MRIEVVVGRVINDDRRTIIDYLSGEFDPCVRRHGARHPADADAQFHRKPSTAQ
jgi:hypothetical protein